MYGRLLRAGGGTMKRSVEKMLLFLVVSLLDVLGLSRCNSKNRGERERVRSVFQIVNDRYSIKNNRDNKTPD